MKALQEYLWQKCGVNQQNIQQQQQQQLQDEVTWDEPTLCHVVDVFIVHLYTHTHSLSLSVSVSLSYTYELIDMHTDIN